MAEENAGTLDALRGQYGLTLAITLFALVPYLLASSAMSLLEKTISRDVGISGSALTLTGAMATAGYAFGALLAGDLSRRYPRKPTYLVLIALTGIGWALVLSNLASWTFSLGYVLIGFATGLLLIVALPPAFRNFPASRLPLTAVFVNIGLFGGVAAGPFAAGLALRFANWQTMFLICALIAVAVLIVGWLVIEPQEAMEPELSLDISAILLAFAATTLPFAAVGLLRRVGFISPWFFGPLTIGLVCFAAIFVVEDRRVEPLIEVDKMVGTMPVIGTLIAAFAGGVFLSVLSLVNVRITSLWSFTEARAGLLLWPLVPGALLAAGTLGLLFKTRYLPVLILIGMVSMIGAGLLLMDAGSTQKLTTSQVALGMLGFGAGSTVSPALFLAGMSLPSATLSRVFAFVELVRSIGDFLIGPVLVEFARLISPGRIAGERQIEITIGIAVALGVGTILFCTIAFLSAFRTLPRPNLEAWLDGKEPAFATPKALRGPEG